MVNSSILKPLTKDLSTTLVTMMCNRTKNKAEKQRGPDTTHCKLYFDTTLTLTSADSLLIEAGLPKMRIYLWFQPLQHVWWSICSSTDSPHPLLPPSFCLFPLTTSSYPFHSPFPRRGGLILHVPLKTAIVSKLPRNAMSSCGPTAPKPEQVCALAPHFSKR